MIGAVLLGGPYDGASLARGPRGSFVWVGGNEDKPRGFARPGGGRCLYRLLAGDRYLWADNTHQICVGCGGFCDRAAATCQFCGTGLREAQAPQ